MSTEDDGSMAHEARVREASRKEAIADAVEEIEREAFRHSGETKGAMLELANTVRRL